MRTHDITADIRLEGFNQIVLQPVKIAVNPCGKARTVQRQAENRQGAVDYAHIPLEHRPIRHHFFAADIDDLAVHLRIEHDAVQGATYIRQGHRLAFIPFELLGKHEPRSAIQARKHAHKRGTFTDDVAHTYNGVRKPRIEKMATDEIEAPVIQQFGNVNEVFATCLFQNVQITVKCQHIHADTQFRVIYRRLAKKQADVGLRGDTDVLPVTKQVGFHQLYPVPAICHAAHVALIAHQARDLVVILSKANGHVLRQVIVKAGYQYIHSLH